MSKFTEEDDALLDELGVEVETQKQASRTPREERIIAGFEEIQRFVEEHGHVPQHGATTSSSDCMQCASIAFVRWRSAARCLNPSIIKSS